MKIYQYLLIFLLFTSCSSDFDSDVEVFDQQTFKWSLVTTWPKNYPGLGMAPERLADLVNEMSNGRLQITVYGAVELVPAMVVFDAVSSGSVEMGHS